MATPSKWRKLETELGRKFRAIDRRFEAFEQVLTVIQDNLKELNKQLLTTQPDIPEVESNELHMAEILDT